MRENERERERGTAMGRAAATHTSSLSIHTHTHTHTQGASPGRRIGDFAGAAPSPLIAPYCASLLCPVASCCISLRPVASIRNWPRMTDRSQRAAISRALRLAADAAAYCTSHGYAACCRLLPSIAAIAPHAAMSRSMDCPLAFDCAMRRNKLRCAAISSDAPQ